MWPLLKEDCYLDWNWSVCDMGVHGWFNHQQVLVALGHDVHELVEVLRIDHDLSRATECIPVTWLI